ncbi:hypothetical protein GCM10020367_65540 [Streptomyces sannanensis]|uniref:Glycosyltransferase RgtA/B/C/D-like domain-containing protein n=1 Tax=Streptomyces sannanensis TaxID=285536 RepID=A0ABP6S4D1_9ACTN
MWLWPALATLAMTMYRIGRPQMGGDELASWDIAGRTAEQLLGTVQRVDAVLGAYYFMLHAWMTVFGESATAVRMPSALAMIGAAVCVALTGQRLFGRRAGLAGGLLFAVIPAVSRFGHEARPYALTLLAVSLATLMLLRALDRPRSWWRWTGYALCVEFIGLMHLVALTALLGHLLAAIFRGRQERRALWGFCIAAVTGVACVVPVILLGRSQASRQLYWIAKPDGWGLVDIWPQIFASALCAGAVIMLAALAWRERNDTLLWCTALAVLPPLVIWVASHGQISYFYFRYMLFTLPAWAVLAGAGLAAAVRFKAALAAALAVLALLTLPVQKAVRETFEHHLGLSMDFEGAARAIRKYYAPGDAVVYDRMEDSRGVSFYLPRELSMRDVFVARSAAELHESDPVYCPRPAECVGKEKRLWLVVRGGDPDPLQGLPGPQADALRAHYTASGTERMTGLTVALLVRKD